MAKFVNIITYKCPISTMVALLLLALVGPACLPDIERPECLENHHCPSGDICDQSLGKCIPDPGELVLPPQECNEHTEGVGEPCNTGLSGPCAEGILVCSPDEELGLVCTQKNMDYDMVDGQCVDRMEVTCIEPGDLPAHTQVLHENVAIHYTNQDGWSTPGVCQWQCEEGFFLEESACTNTKEVPCTIPDTPFPPGMEPEVVGVAIHYEEAEPGEWQWTEPALCSLICIEGHILDENQCLDSKEVLCSTEGLPDNSTPELGMVTITPVLVDSQWGWDEPETCPWHCNTGYGMFELNCYPYPIVDSLMAELLRPNSAVLGGEVVADGGLPIIQWGIVAGFVSKPNPGNSDPESGVVLYEFHEAENGELEGSTFEITTPEHRVIPSDTDIYFRAYAKSEAGFGYGQERRLNIRKIERHNPQSAGNNSIGNIITLPSYTVPLDVGDHLVLVVFVGGA